MKLFAVDLYSLTPEDIAAIEALGYEVTVAKPDQAPDEVCRDEEIEVALCEHGYLKKHMGKMPNVKMIQMTYAGLDLMGPELFEVYKDAAICGGSGIYGVPLAEWSVSKVLDIYRRERHFEQHRKEHKWSWEGSTETAELWGKTVLLLGTGDIGAACARRFGAFGCRVIGVNTTGRAVEGFDECHPISALDPLLPAADVVVVCLPRTPATIGLLDASRLAALKKGAVLVVNSRGRIIDEEALCRLLDEGHLKGAALDCFATEPLPEDSPLWSQKNLSVTPHRGGVTKAIRRFVLRRYLENLARYRDGRPLLARIDYSRGY